MAVSLIVQTAFIGLITSIFVYVYLKIKNIHNYWAKRNVVHLKPKLLGNLMNLPVKGLYDFFKDLYHENKQHKVVGLWSLHRPSLLINDLELIKKILVQDANHFQDRGGYYNEKDDPLAANLFALDGTKWRNLRVKLTPTFTSGKMKFMFPTLMQISQNLQKICNILAKANDTFDAKEIIARFTTDIIASCAFGIQTNCLDNPEAEFREIGKKIFEPTWPTLLRNTTAFLLPDVARKLKLITTPPEVTKFFISVLHESINYRKENHEERKDFLQLLINLMDKESVEDVDYSSNDNQRAKQSFTFNEAAAQAFIFYVGGFETSSSALQFTLYELAKNQDIQNHLREEISQQLKNDGGQMTYEGIHKMKYMGQVLDETLRKYPPAPFLNRECNIRYKVPNTELVIEKGVTIFIPIVGIQTDAQYFPNPDKFDPERFSDTEKASRPNYVYLPFGDGIRVCIGQRFAQMQMRMALTALISHFRFEVCQETPERIKFDPKSIFLSPLNSIKLKISTTSV